MDREEQTIVLTMRILVAVRANNQR
jgi:hypothetical protein